MPTVLIVTDADWVFDEVDAALADNDTTLVRVHEGVGTIPAIKRLPPDLVILDLQIGNMGGMATCMAIRLEESADRIDITPVLMLLDRAPDTFLARRADADGWLVKPLDAFRLRRAAEALLDGGEWFEGDERAGGAEATADRTGQDDIEVADLDEADGDEAQTAAS